MNQRQASTLAGTIDVNHDFMLESAVPALTRRNVPDNVDNTEEEVDAFELLAKVQSLQLKQDDVLKMNATANAFRKVPKVIE